MQNNKFFERDPDFIFRKIVDEAILVPIQRDVADMDCIYTLNDVGAFIWEHLAQPTTQENLEAALLEEYEEQAEVIKGDLASFLSEMLSIGAIKQN